MPDPLDPGRIRALLLDIEGTTTPVDFVTRVLFPYARARVRDFLIQRAGEPAIQDDLARLLSEHQAEESAGQSPPPWRDGSPSESLDSAVAYVHWLMDRDRKSTALKSLQGRIWDEGYQAGHLRGQVYPDVSAALARWRAEGRDVAIFSSGSVLAQRLLFSRSEAGDLTAFIRAYFDTTTGAKGDPESYRKIAHALGHAPAAVLFLSDVIAELDAARGAGMATVLCVRGKGAGVVRSTPPLEDRARLHPARAEDAAVSVGHPEVNSFDEVLSTRMRSRGTLS